MEAAREAYYDYLTASPENKAAAYDRAVKLLRESINAAIEMDGIDTGTQQVLQTLLDNIDSRRAIGHNEEQRSVGDKDNPWGSDSDLLAAATIPGKGGVTPVGRAFQKHGGNPNRAGTFVGEVSGNAGKNTEQGIKYLMDILSNPESSYTLRHTDVFGDILDVRLPDGTGARWSADGTRFIGFLEKYSK